MIRNISGDRYRLACISCGAISDLEQVAHRNRGGFISEIQSYKRISRKPPRISPPVPRISEKVGKLR